MTKIERYPICIKRFTAFTLSEVLITLAIIGVVIALTIPTVIKNYQKRQTVVKLKKNYTILSQVLYNSSIENGVLNNWDYSLSSKDFYNKYFKKYLKVSKELGVGSPSNFSKTPYKGLDGSILKSPHYNVFSSSTYNVVLNDGTYLFVNVTGLVIDINGAQKPNVAGKDTFFFTISQNLNGYMYRDGKKLKRSELLSKDIYMCNKNASYGGSRCTSLIILDNWEIKDDYPW